MAAAPVAEESCTPPKVEVNGECLAKCASSTNKTSPEQPCACQNPNESTYSKISNGQYCCKGPQAGPLVGSGEKVTISGSTCSAMKLIPCGIGKYCFQSGCFDPCTPSLNTQSRVCACLGLPEAKAVLAAPGQVCYENKVYNAQEAEKVASGNVFCAGKETNKLCTAGQYCVDGECYNTIPNCPSGLITQSVCVCGENNCYFGSSCVDSKCMCAENVLLPKKALQCGCGSETCNQIAGAMCIKGKCVLELKNGDQNTTDQLMYCISSSLSFVEQNQYCLDGKAVDNPACVNAVISNCQCFPGDNGFCPSEGEKECIAASKKCLPKCDISDAAVTQPCICPHYYKSWKWIGPSNVALEVGDFCIQHPDRPQDGPQTRAYSACSANSNQADVSRSCHCGPTLEPCGSGENCQYNECKVVPPCQKGALVTNEYCALPREDNSLVLCYRGQYVERDYECHCQEDVPFVIDIMGCQCGNSRQSSDTPQLAICQPSTQTSKTNYLPVCQHTEVEPVQCWCDQESKGIVGQYGKCWETCSSRQARVGFRCIDCPATCKTCDSDLKCTLCKSSLKGGEKCAYKGGLLAAIIVPCVVVLLVVIGVATWLVLRRKPVAKVGVSETERPKDGAEETPEVAGENAAEN